MQPRPISSGTSALVLRDIDTHDACAKERVALKYRGTTPLSASLTHSAVAEVATDATAFCTAEATCSTTW